MNTFVGKKKKENLKLGSYMWGAKEFLAMRRIISLNKTFILFVEIMTGDIRHTQQIHIVPLTASLYF